MPHALRYFVDDKGEKTSVLVPFKVWKDLNANYQKLQKKLDILTSVTEELDEVRKARKTGRRLHTLKDFLK